MFRLFFGFYLMSKYLLIGYYYSLYFSSFVSPLERINIFVDFMFFLFLLLLLYFGLFYFYFFFVFPKFCVWLIFAVLPFDLCKLAGLNFLFSIYGFFDSFFLDGPLIMLFSTWPDFFFGFIENYLVLDLFSTISPQDKLYFFLFSAIISLKLLVSS